MRSFVHSFPVKPIKSIHRIMIRRLSCCCCTMMHVLLSSTARLKFPKTSLKTQRSEACWKVRDASCQLPWRLALSLFFFLFFSRRLVYRPFTQSMPLISYIFSRRVADASCRKNRREETGGETSGGCEGRRPIDSQSAGW